MDWAVYVPPPWRPGLMSGRYDGTPWPRASWELPSTEDMLLFGLLAGVGLYTRGAVVIRLAFTQCVSVYK